MSSDGQKCEIKAFVNPLVFWLWFGAAVMVFGTGITLLPDRKGAFSLPATRLVGEIRLEEHFGAKAN